MNRTEEEKGKNSSAKALNLSLVDALVKQGQIRTAAVEDAFRDVLRHHFLPGLCLEEVYANRAIALKQDDEGAWESSSSQPSMMAIMLEQLDLQPGHNVLEIGAGSGYNAALMAHIVGERGRVVTVDIDADLVAAARANLQEAGARGVTVVCADGGYGYAEAAPYDRILLTVAADEVTPAWRAQLAVDGRLLMPLDLGGVQRSVAFVRADDHLKSVSAANCGFIPLRGAFGIERDRRIQLGPDSNLFLEPTTAGAFEATTVYRLLRGGYQETDSGVAATTAEIVFGLKTWLVAEPGLAQLSATGEMAEGDLVPPLSRITHSENVALTIVLVAEEGMAALARAADAEVPFAGIDALFASSEPFPLYVRHFGSDDGPAQRLIARVRAWGAAGKPTTSDLRICAYARDAGYEPEPGEIVVTREWTQFVLDWRGATAG